MVKKLNHSLISYLSKKFMKNIPTNSGRNRKGRITLPHRGLNALLKEN